MTTNPDALPQLVAIDQLAEHLGSSPRTSPVSSPSAERPTWGSAASFAWFASIPRTSPPGSTTDATACRPLDVSRQAAAEKVADGELIALPSGWTRRFPARQMVLSCFRRSGPLQPHVVKGYGTCYLAPSPVGAHTELFGRLGPQRPSELGCSNCLRSMTPVTGSLRRARARTSQLAIRQWKAV